VLITPFGERSALTVKLAPPLEEPSTGGRNWNTSVVLTTRFMSKSGGQASWPLITAQSLDGSVPMITSVPLATPSPSWSVVALFGTGELEAAEIRRDCVPSAARMAAAVPSHQPSSSESLPMQFESM